MPNFAFQLTPLCRWILTFSRPQAADGVHNSNQEGRGCISWCAPKNSDSIFLVRFCVCRLSSAVAVCDRAEALSEAVSFVMRVRSNLVFRQAIGNEKSRNKLSGYQRLKVFLLLEIIFWPTVALDIMLYHLPIIRLNQMIGMTHIHF